MIINGKSLDFTENTVKVFMESEKLLEGIRTDIENNTMSNETLEFVLGVDIDACKLNISYFTLEMICLDPESLEAIALRGMIDALSAAEKAIEKRLAEMVESERHQEVVESEHLEEKEITAIEGAGSVHMEESLNVKSMHKSTPTTKGSQPSLSRPQKASLSSVSCVHQGLSFDGPSQ